MSDTAFEYGNLTGRPTGRLWTTGARIIPGLAQTREQMPRYAAAWRDSNLAALRGSARRWVVLGDSMSLGIGASDPFAGWVGQLHRRLAGAGIRVEVLNLAASGARAGDVVEQQVPVWQSLPTPAAGELVTVLVGSNDLFNRGSRARLPADFAALLAQLPAGAVVATLPQPRRAAYAVNALIEQARAGRALRVVDLRVSGPQSWRGKLAPDHFHPNDLGYSGMADAFEPLVRVAARA